MSNENKKRLSAVKHALLSSKLHERRDDINLLHSEPIAIIGTACRFPGGVSSTDAYWKLLVTGTDAITEIPAERWNRDDYFDADSAAPGKINTLYGGFLEGIDQFDPRAFGIAPREARYMDPQHRLLLEVAWSAFEDSGNPLESIRNSKTGVFFGVSNSDYGRMQLNNTLNISAHTLSGTAPSISAGRLSYLFDLRGPSMVIDTACSSSLVAVHTAIQSLRNRDSDLAVAGGVSLNVMPEETISLAKWGMLSPDGRCKTFDEQANGFVRSEGCGLVVLKRLSDALRDRDTVRAVIRGSAINQDGRSNVLTAPNGVAQREVISAALHQAALDGADISFVETHGTGTKVGDPIEVEALLETIGRHAENDRTCYLGAVKANLGHLEAAAGVAGLIKVVLCLQHRTIPPQIHYRKLNPLMSLDGSALKIPETAVAWEAGASGRIAGLSSFGFSGTNVHMIIEEAPLVSRPELEAEREPGRPIILPISAKHADGVTKLSVEYDRVLQQELSRSQLTDICFTASRRRTHFSFRDAAVGHDATDLRQSLSRIRNRSPRPGPAAEPKLGFVYSGQGCNWYGMARTLLRREAVFEAALTLCDKQLKAVADWSIIDELHADCETTRLNQTAFFQPVLFAIQFGLTKLWDDWGIRPSAVVGHSVGEVAAAHTAGILSLSDAMQLVELRSRLMQKSVGQGAMAAIGLPLQELRKYIKDEPELFIAASNGPGSSTLSGNPEKLARILTIFEKNGVFCRQLDVDCAFHSNQMEQHVRPLEDGLSDTTFLASRVQFFSTVSGRRAGSGNESEYPLLDAAYWGRNVRDPVLFSEAVGTMIDAGCTAFVEIGPHAVLSAYISEITDEREAPCPVFASMRRDTDDDRVMKEALAGLYGHGCNPDWGRIAPTGRVISLPTYPWDKDRYWLDWLDAGAPRQASARSEGIHPLLGSRIDSPAVEQVIFENVIAADAPAYLSEHRIGGVCLFPATAMIEMMLAAGNELTASTRDDKEGCPAATIVDFGIEQPLIIPDIGSRRIQLVVDDADTSAEMRIYSRSIDATDDWILHATATWHPTLLHEPDSVAKSNFLPQASELEGRHLNVDEFYAEGRRIGVDFGPAFRSLTDVVVNDGFAVGHVGLRAEELRRQGRYVVHPVLLDGCLQTVDAALRQGERAAALLLPFVIKRIDYLRPWNGLLHAVASLMEGAGAESAGSMLDARIDVTDDDGNLIIVMHGVRMKVTGPDTLRRFKESAEIVSARLSKPSGWTYSVNWRQEPLPAVHEVTEEPRQLLICTNETEMCRLLIDNSGASRCARSVHILHPHEFPAEITASQYEVDPYCQKTFVAAVRQIREKASDASAPIELDVVFLWNLKSELSVASGAEPRSLDFGDGEAAIAAALHLMQALTMTSGIGHTSTLIVSRGAHSIADLADCDPGQAALWGLGITVQVEHPELHCRLLDLDPTVDFSNDIDFLWNEIRATRTAEDRVAYRDKRRFVARLSHDNTCEQEKSAIDHLPFQISAPESGTFDDLATEALIRIEPGPNEVEIETAALGINFRDVLNVLNEVSGPAGRNLGAECSGKIIAVGSAVDEFQVGDDVFSFAIGGFASHVTVPAELVAKIPLGMGIVEAAGVPVVFLTAHYALNNVVQLHAGQSVLIHAAAGGVGQAAIQLAQNAGATIFATAGTAEKRALLRRLDIEHVFDSRATTFAIEIMQATQGQGLDVVLNSLAGDFIPAGLSVVKPGGMFIELGKRDEWDREKVAADYPEVGYRRFDLGEIAAANPDLIQDMLHDIVAGFEAGNLHVLPDRLFSLNQLSDAFRYMAQGKHVGKLIVPVTRTQSAEGVIDNATYLITGGLGALGMDIADRLVADGATQLVLISRTEGTPEAQARVERMRTNGATVHVEQADVANFKSLRNLIDTIDSTMPPLRGVVHCAGVLQDAAFSKQTWDKFQVSMGPKIYGAWNLHALTRNRTLDFFVLFSSASAILGWPGQSNYAVGNAYMDALAHFRRARGQAALSINWGIWRAAGMAENVVTTSGDRFTGSGLLSHSSDKAVDTFTNLLVGHATQVLVGNFDWNRFADRYVKSQIPCFYAEVCRSHSGQPENDLEERSVVAHSIIADLEVAPAGQKMRILVRFVEEQAAAVLGLAAGQSIDRKVPLNEQGLDSLLAVELRNVLSASLGEKLPATILFDYPTINLLSEHLGNKITPLQSQIQIDDPSDQLPGDALAASVDDMPESEAEDLLQQELDNLAAADRS